MYVREVYDLGLVMQVKNFYPGNYGAPGKKRAEKRKRTPEEMKRQNEKNRWRRLQRIILANFKAGDWHLILKYKKGTAPEDYKEAVVQRRRFVGKMRDSFRRAGIPFKWIAVTERGKKGQVLHHHLIIEDIADGAASTVQLVKKYWTHGNAFFVSLYEDGEYEKLAEYIVKAETKEECGWCTYCRSRNLIIPQPKRKVMKRRIWKKEPPAKKGWYVVKDSIVNGINPFTERPYQYYTMRRLEAGKAERLKGGTGGG